MSKRSGGVMIKSMKPGGLGSASGKLKRSMSLLEINSIDVSKLSFKDIVTQISNRNNWNGEGMVTLWNIAPSRSLDAEGKARVHPPEQEADNKSKQTPETRGRQRDRMNPNEKVSQIKKRESSEQM